MLRPLARLLLCLLLLPLAFWCDVRDGHFDDYLTNDSTDR